MAQVIREFESHRFRQYVKEVLNKSTIVIPAKAGIQFKHLDPGFCRGDDLSSVSLKRPIGRFLLGHEKIAGWRNLPPSPRSTTTATARG